ncbi:MAG: hypothetical protein ACFB0B_06815 [Thermonemataceae bacterium]
MKYVSTFCLCIFISLGIAKAQQPLETRVNLLFGLSQPLFVDGFNIEGNFFYNRIAFDYSHGVSLDFTGSAITGELADQQLEVHMPYTTGFGIGYRFNEWFNLRLEPKWHRFELYYEGISQESQSPIVAYNTFSLGLGAYINWLPFKRQDNFLKGIMVAPSIRFWPRVSSSLEEDVFTYFNERTNEQVTHNAMEAGVGNTPFIFNVSIGYSLKL